MDTLPLHFVKAVNVPGWSIVGRFEIVTIAVTEHPVFAVYVIVAVPAETPVTNPLLTLATEESEVVQAFVLFAVPEPVN